MKSVQLLMVPMLWLVACAGERASRPSPESAPPQSAQSGAAPDPSRSGGDQTAQVNISSEIQKACGITSSEAYFAYNSAKLRRQEEAVLEKLARCFTDGALAGRGMLRVGRADQRGEDEYNLVLGEHRAGSVKKALVKKQLHRDKISTSSRGEMDATGTDESSWASDRRVDVLLRN